MIDPTIPVKTKPPLGQHRRTLIGVGAVNPFSNQVSPGRMQMLTNSHLAQSLTTLARNEPYIQTGIETELGKATFCVKMPVRGKILRIIERYPYKEGTDSINHNPESTIIFEDTETKELGMVTIKDYFSYHSYFGYQYKRTKALDKLVVGDVVEAGTIFLDSPSKTETGNYAYGVELNVAMLGHPAITDDGVVICRDQLEKFTFDRYETRSVEFGDKQFALLREGGKIFPDIGEEVGIDGLIMATRTFNPRMAPVDLSVNAMKQVDYPFDRHIHAYGPRGVVVDVIVTTNFDITKGITDMNAQMKKYIQARHSYCRAMVDTYYQFKKNNKGLKISRQLHLALVRAMVELRTGSQRLTKLYRRAPLDHFRIDFVIKYSITPYIGCKFTGKSGDKGILTYIAEPDEMPVDADGTRADLLMGPEARTNRSNIGGLAYHYFTGAMLKTRRLVCQELGLELRPPTSHKYASVTPQNERETQRQQRWALENVRQIYDTDPPRFWRAWNWIIMFYRCISPINAYMYDQDGALDDDKIVCMANAVADAIYVFAPQDYMPDYYEAAKAIEKYIKPTYDSVHYKGYSGIREKTDSRVRVAPLSILLLEKTASDWSAVSSPRIQAHGFWAQVSKSDKYFETGKRQPIRGFGETEFRIVAAYCGAQAVAEIADRNNNPATHHAINMAILEAKNPTNIRQFIDRSKNPYGNHKGIQALRHVLNCIGIDVAYVAEEEEDIVG